MINDADFIPVADSFRPIGFSSRNCVNRYHFTKFTVSIHDSGCMLFDPVAEDHEMHGFDVSGDERAYLMFADICKRIKLKNVMAYASGVNMYLYDDGRYIVQFVFMYCKADVASIDDIRMMKVNWFMRGDDRVKVEDFYS